MGRVTRWCTLFETTPYISKKISVFLILLGTIHLVTNISTIRESQDYVTNAVQWKNARIGHAHTTTTSINNEKCYVYMMPIAFGRNYFHFWDGLFASLRISGWNFTCTDTAVYVPPKNMFMPYIDIVKEIFGEFNVLAVDELNAYTIDKTLSAMSSYFNQSTLQITDYNHTRLWLHPLHHKIVSSSISLNYTKYGAFGQMIKFVFTQKDLPDYHELFNAIYRPTSKPWLVVWSQEISAYSYLRKEDESQQWLHEWRLYLINNTLQLNANDYDLDYYTNHGYISIVNRHKARHISDSDTHWLNYTLSNVLHVNWSRIRFVYYDDLSWKEQLGIALESTIIITPHGAGELNSIMMHPSFSFHLELCPWYSHCKGLCPRFYKQFYKRTKDCENLEGERYIGARDLAIDISSPMTRSQIVQSIASHLMHLNHFSTSRQKKYQLMLKKQLCQESVNKNVSWEQFIAQYC